MHPPVDLPSERPLSRAARLILIATTAATIALFYLFISLTILLLVGWIAVVFVAVIAAARFGLAGLLVRFLERDAQLLALLARSLWLKESAKFRLALKPKDAPRLFAMVSNLAGRFQIPPPDELCLEMNCGAWVELRGIKTGLGTTRVGVGYDLLAGLNESEVEAVLAHELAHAKLIGRAFNNWLSAGLRRAATVSTALSRTADAYRRADRSFGFGPWVLAIADSLTQLCARQWAACSRQGEFEADLGAAELCGSPPLRSALRRLETIQPTLARLPWNERVAQIESPEGLSRWLTQALADVDSAPAASEPEIFDRYSSHPTLRDRLNQLPGEEAPRRPGATALGLLANPDGIALQLVVEIERSILAEERKDLRELKRWTRSLRRTGSYRAAQLPGMLLVCVAVVVGGIGLAMQFWILGAIMLLAGIPLGLWLNRLGHYRDRRDLPVPDFAVFMHARDDASLSGIEERQKTLESEFTALIASEPKKKIKAQRLIAEAYAALAKCDYLRAHVAARLAENFQKKSIERDTVMMVAAAAFAQHDLFNHTSQALLKETALRTPATSWATAWALMLTRDWMPAEALLHETLRARPDHLDLRAMLALCQSRRGKLQSALENIRQTCTPKAPTKEHLKLLTGLLLDRGALREATPAFAQFGPADAYDPDTVYLRVRHALLRPDFVEAEKQLAMLDLDQLSSRRLVALGLLYETPRADTTATGFFERALQRGHYPEAQLALARLASKARDKARARAHIYAALDTTKPLGETAASAFDLLHPALAELFSLEDPHPSCRAWIATVLPGKEPGPLAKRRLMVFAPTEKAAAEHVQTLQLALQPHLPPLPPGNLSLKSAPRDLQPNRPVRPGVQYIYQ